MNVFIPITDKKGNTYYLAAETIRMIQLQGKDDTVIYCLSGSSKQIKTATPVEAIVNQIHQNSPTKRLIPFTNSYGVSGYLSVDYIGHIEADKRGNAQIHCVYGDTREIIGTKTTVQEIMTHIQQVGGVIVQG